MSQGHLWLLLLHIQNFLKQKMGQPIYDIPHADPIKEFFATDAAKRDRICLDIPNTEIDSPLNWKIHTQYNTSGSVNSLGQTNRNLNYSRYFQNKPPHEVRYERTAETTVKDWFFNNINWLFWDIDKNRSIHNPDINRYMNIVGELEPTPNPSFKPMKLLDAQGSLV